MKQLSEDLESKFPSEIQLIRKFYFTINQEKRWTKKMDAMRNVKVVYEDDGNSKVVRGLILEQDEFTITLKCTPANNTLILGKRAIVKISEEGGF